MKIQWLLFVLMSFCICAVHAQKIKPASGPKLENWIIDTIMKLPEVKEGAAYVKKQTNGKRRLSYMIFDKPTKENSYYWVKVMEDNGDAAVTHFDFHVYPKPIKIKFYDAVNDETIDLDQWRKTRNRSSQQ